MKKDKKNSRKSIALLTISTLVVIVLVFMVVAWVGARKNSEKVSLNNALLEGSDNGGQVYDSDKDGLLDWEEALWETDPNNRDTDGDGVDDGKEVAQGSNPKESGGKGLFEIATPTEDSNDNATEIFSKQLLSRLISAKASGQDLSPESVAYITSNYLSSEFEYQTHAFRDLNISNNDTDSDIRDYVNTLGSVLKTEPGYRNETVIIYDFAQKQDWEILKELKDVSVEQEDIVSELLSLVVPQELSGIHLSLINSVSATSKDLEILSEIEPNDTLSFITALGQYQKNSDVTAKTLNSLRDFLNRRNINFEQGEDGYIITNID